MDKQYRTGKYVVHLITSLLKNESPNSRPEDITYEDIYHFAVFHNVTVMVLEALKQTEQDIDPQLFSTWERKTEAAIAQSMIQMSEREALYHIFEDNQIPYLPLKGCIIKDMYPDPHYRQMADLDILVRREDAKKVKTLVENTGYNGKSFNNEKNDAYYKNPFLHLEIHYQLFGTDHFELHDWDRKYTDFLIDPWTKAVRKEQTYQYLLDDNSLYIYLILHLAVHYYGSGVGIRQFTDLYYLNRNLILDKEYIYEELDHFDLKDFCITAEEMVSSWFENAAEDERISEMEKAVFSSGVYGNADRKFKNRISKYEKDHSIETFYGYYIMKRLFPPLNSLRPFHPVLRKYPALLPFVWLKRILTKGILAVPKELKNLKIIRKNIKEQKN